MEQDDYPIEIIEPDKLKKKVDIISGFHCWASLTTHARSSSTPSEYKNMIIKLRTFVKYLFDDQHIKEYMVLEKGTKISKIKVYTSDVDTDGKRYHLEHIHFFMLVTHNGKVQIRLGGDDSVHKLKNRWFGKSNCRFDVKPSRSSSEEVFIRYVLKNKMKEIN